MRLILVSVLFGLTAQFIMKENVIFQRVKEVTTVRAKWMVTFVEELLPFERFLNKTQYTTIIALRAVLKFQAIIAKYNPEKKNWISAAFGANTEVDNLNKTCIEIMNKFQDLKSMYYDKTVEKKFRSKRALIPIIGKALSFLFGTVSEDDLNSIRSNLRTLTISQNKLIHVVQEGMTILNTTQGRIIENREKINNIIDVIHNVSHKLVSVSTTVGILQSYLHGYNHIGLAISEVKDMLTIAGDYLGQLQLKLNMLSMGHLSPSVITPHNLRILLSDIKSKLPPHLRLPKDEKKTSGNTINF